MSACIAHVVNEQLNTFSTGLFFARHRLLQGQRLLQRKSMHSNSAFPNHNCQCCRFSVSRILLLCYRDTTKGTKDTKAKVTGKEMYVTVVEKAFSVDESRNTGISLLNLLFSGLLQEEEGRYAYHCTHTWAW